MAPAADMTHRRVSTGESQQPCPPALRRRRGLHLGRKLAGGQLTAPRQVALAMTVREQTEVTDPHEAFGQDVQQETGG